MFVNHHILCVQSQKGHQVLQFLLLHFQQILVKGDTKVDLVSQNLFWTKSMSTKEGKSDANQLELKYLKRKVGYFINATNLVSSYVNKLE